MKNGILMVLVSVGMAVGCSQQSTSQMTSLTNPSVGDLVPEPGSPMAISNNGVATSSPSVSANPVSPTVAPTISAANKDPKSIWAQRNTLFARMSSWRFQGRVGLRVKQQSASFTLSWLQHGNGGYEMNIKNPLTGSVMAYLNSNGNSVTMKAVDGKVYQDSSAERLLQQRMGMSLPLTGMRYWARGVASPKDPIEALELDNLGRPKLLQQNGWVVTYGAYLNNSPTALPTKMEIERAADQVRVKVLAKDWKTAY